MNGSSSGSITLGPGQRCIVFSDGSNYWAQEMPVRFRLGANTTFYVSTTGNDSNNGLAIASPWTTLQHAYNVLQEQYDLAGFVAIVQLADGTYTNNALNAIGSVTGCAGPGFIIFNGDSGTPSNVLITCTTSSLNAFIASGGAQFTIQNMKVQASGSGACAVVTNNSGSIQINTGIIFGATNSVQIQANYGGFINVGASYTIASGGSYHMQSNIQGVIFILSGITVTLTGTPAFSQAFADATVNGSITPVGVTYSGSATGSRYAATLNGVIVTGTSGGATYFPGNSAGTTATGGQYY